MDVYQCKICGGFKLRHTDNCKCSSSESHCSIAISELLDQHNHYDLGNGWSVGRNSAMWNVYYRGKHVDAYREESEQSTIELKSYDTAIEAICEAAIIMSCQGLLDSSKDDSSSLVREAVNLFKRLVLEIDFIGEKSDELYWRSKYLIAKATGDTAMKDEIEGWMKTDPDMKAFFGESR